MRHVGPACCDRAPSLEHALLLSLLYRALDNTHNRQASMTSYGHVTTRLSKDNFLYVLSRNQTRILLTFRDIFTKPCHRSCNHSTQHNNCASCQSHNRSARFLPLIRCQLERHPSPTIRQRCSIHQYIQASPKIILF